MSNKADPLHFVVGTTASFSHVPPLVNLAISLVSSNAEIYVSLLIHANNLSNCEKILTLRPDARDKIKFIPVGEKRTEKGHVSQSYMDMVYGSGEKYAGLLLDTAWPAPTVFIFDITSFFYCQVKPAVEANFPHIKPLRLVGYNPEAGSELVYHIGDIENGSLRWVGPELIKTGVETPFSPKKDSDKSGETLVFQPSPEALQAYREVVTESERRVEISGYPPFDVYERWSTAVDWSLPQEFGWFQYLQGIQSVASLPEAWVGCFPSDVLEPEIVSVIEQDGHIGDNGKKPFFQAGWFEVKSDGLEGEFKAFLDRFGPKEVVYISFGTIVDAGEGFPVLLQELEESKTPFIFAGGKQKSLLSDEIQQLLTRAEKEGRAIAPDWVDQVDVLAHPSIMCFVSHCGVNSTIEAILAGVPLLAWGRRWDQISLSAQIGAKGLGIELIQHREGHGKGRSPAHRPGDIIQGGAAAVKAELQDAFARVKGDEGDRIRYNQQRMAESIRAKRQKEWAENVDRFVQWSQK